jgi:ribonuclease HII
MMNLHELHPQYGFAQHMGYPTEAHFAALKEFGACDQHRRSFSPVRNVLALHSR